MNEIKIRNELRAWIVAHSKNQNVGEISNDTPILEKGILSSLDIVEFVLFIESLRGQEVDTDAIEPDAFVSLDAIWAAFFANQ